MKNNFENLDTSILQESFDTTMESIEKRFTFQEDPAQAALLNHRHSISSRFLSHAQHQHLRYPSNFLCNIGRQGRWHGAVVRVSDSQARDMGSMI